MPPFKETKRPATKPAEEVLAKVKEPEVKEPEVKEPEVKEPEVKEPKTFSVKKLRCSSSIYMVNPFTGDRFLPNDEVEATLDSWLECQIAAGLVKCH